MGNQVTEIQFLLDIILDTRTLTEVRRKCKERIGEVEANIGQRPAQPAPRLAQAASTIAAMERHAAEPIPPVAMPTLAPRIMGGEVDTGNGTRGKRKF